MTLKMRVAVVGGGVSGLAAAYVAADGGGVEVVLYEKEDHLGGLAKTFDVDGTSLDLGFMLLNRVNYPNMMELLEDLGVDMEFSDMSFSVSLDEGRGCEWGSRGGVFGLFAQKKNAMNPYFWNMIREIVKFKSDVLNYVEELESNPDIDRNQTLGSFVQSRGYSELFQKAYLIPICGSIWSCSSEGVMSFSAYSILSFCRNHHLLQLFGPQRLAVRWPAQNYVNKVVKVLESRGCQIRTNTQVCSVSGNDESCVVRCKDGSEEEYDGCIIASHALDALRMLGNEATFDELRILGAFQYAYSDVYLHRDKSLMPKNRAAWGAWNFLGSANDKACITYCLNILQNIEEKGHPFLVTVSPPSTPQHTLLRWKTGHPIPSVAATKASSQLNAIQGKRRIWFCGEYQGNDGFHEGGLKAGILAGNGLLGRSIIRRNNPKFMVPSWLETGAQFFVAGFFRRFITTGCLIFLENGGTTYTFGGSKEGSSLNVVLRVHNPQFYWKLATKADLGLADAYIDGDFSFVDKKEGLLNLFMLFIVNRDLNTSTAHLNKKRGWWTPLLLTSAVASAKYFLHHVSRQNTVAQARRNISTHYDLSNELFSLFLDETMAYSCAIFKYEGEDPKIAQLRKFSLLIETAKIKKDHHILEIGSGWGTLAIEVVRKTNCKYTGITLSKEQLKYAELKAKEAGLEDRVKFLLCDYRQLPNKEKYDRIIACELLEAVGHEFMGEFFRCCESALVEDGVLVVQFTSIPDQRYNEYRRSSDFIKEYIFPGGCLPCVSRVISAMVTASRFCVEHLEDIGIHYYHTIRYWRENFDNNQSKIKELGFDDKFIRTWEYYFDYCAAGFKTCTLKNYQIVFSRPGNVSAFGDPYKGVPSAY